MLIPHANGGAYLRASSQVKTPPPGPRRAVEPLTAGACPTAHGCSHHRGRLSAATVVQTVLSGFLAPLQAGPHRVLVSARRPRRSPRFDRWPRHRRQPSRTALPRLNKISLRRAGRLLPPRLLDAVRLSCLPCPDLLQRRDLGPQFVQGANSAGPTSSGFPDEPCTRSRRSCTTARDPWRDLLTGWFRRHRFGANGFRWPRAESARWSGSFRRFAAVPHGVSATPHSTGRRRP